MTRRKDYLNADIRNAEKNRRRRERYAATKREKSKHIDPVICRVGVNTIRMSPDVATSMETDVQNTYFKTSSVSLVNNYGKAHAAVDKRRAFSNSKNQFVLPCGANEKTVKSFDSMSVNVDLGIDAPVATHDVSLCHSHNQQPSKDEDRLHDVSISSVDGQCSSNPGSCFGIQAIDALSASLHSGLCDRRISDYENNDMSSNLYSVPLNIDPQLQLLRYGYDDQRMDTHGGRMEMVISPSSSAQKQTDINVLSLSNICSTDLHVQNRRHQRKFRRVQTDVLQDIATESIQLPEVSDCHYCGAKRFNSEPPNFCCASGQIRLLETEMPQELMLLYLGTSEEANTFRNCIRSYNNMFAFTSIGMHCDKQLMSKYHGVYSFRVQGQVYHFINPLIPEDGRRPTNLQLYFYDTDHEVVNRMSISNRFTESLITKLAALLQQNPYSSFFRRLQNLPNLDNYKIVLESNPAIDQKVLNKPAVSQVGAIWNESDTFEQSKERHIEVYSANGHAQLVKHYFSCYDPLQYPLIFANGEPGWHPGIERLVPPQNNSSMINTCPGEQLKGGSFFTTATDLINAENKGISKNNNKRKTVSCREYYCYKLQIRAADRSNLLHIGRLLQQYVVDMYIKIETSRLDFYRHDQRQRHLRTEFYQGLLDSLSKGEQSTSNVGKRIILPKSFIGGPRDMKRRYMDAMSLVQQYGKPDLFLTMTCNKNWPEIQKKLLPFEKAENRPDLISRVFRAKLLLLKNELFKRHIFGQVAAYTYVIEFQKRGLPHAHFLIILERGSKMYNPDAYDRIVSAELPDPTLYPHLHSLVAQHMIHGPCGSMNPDCPCMRQNICKDGYPKAFIDITRHNHNAYPLYRRTDSKRYVKVRGWKLDNRWVVPYNPYLLSRFDCHMNVEICSTIQAVKYIYKYIYKGHDKILYQLRKEQVEEVFDEIRNFQSARWISPPEAIWRIYGFDLNEMHPSVMTLSVHLDNHQSINFPENRDLESIARNDALKRTMLTEFFNMNRTDDVAKNLNCLYTEFPQYFVWDADSKIWTFRKQRRVIGRLAAVHPSENERYYLRLLLKHVRKPTSFEDLKTVSGLIATSFQQAAETLGLLNSDNNVELSLAEAILYEMPSQLRHLFATILVYCSPKNPKELWYKFKDFLSEDLSHNPSLSTENHEVKVLHIIDSHLQLMGRTITEYGFSQVCTRDLAYEKEKKEIESEKCIIVSEEDLLSISKLNIQQRSAYDKILFCVNNNLPRSFFIDGPGGTGKTYLYKALLAKIRSEGHIALATATSGVAASILPGGRTAHSRFKIPIQHDESKSCNISKQSAIAELIRQAKIIIWDEATMAKRRSVEVLNAMLQDVLDSSDIFGGKVVVFGGDFRQTLPVIPHTTKDDIISASLVMSPLWKDLEKIRLTENMRAFLDPDFSNFLLRVGNGTETRVVADQISIPKSIMLPFMDDEYSASQLIDITFPNLESANFITSGMINRAILMTRNDFVHDINHILISKFSGCQKTYFSYDEVLDTSMHLQDQDLLHSLTPNGLPLHELVLKIDCPVILLRNISPAEGLSNGTRLICKAFADNVIQAEIAIGSFAGKMVFIPRIPLQASDDDFCSIPFKRTQFPLRLCFAMTINKAQGQTLDFVGLYLKEPVFSHGQLYVALSRARSSADIRILVKPLLMQNGNPNLTRNVVYDEVLSLASDL